MEPDERDEFELTGASMLRREPGWLSAAVGAEAVLMDAASGRSIGLTETGARIWTLLAEPRTLSALCAALAAEYDAPADRIEAEMTPFLRDLIAHRALTAATS